MKKIIGIIFVSLMFANIGFAEIREIENEYLRADRYIRIITTVCVDGYKFVITQANNDGGISMVQFMRQHTHDSLPVPEKC